MSQSHKIVFLGDSVGKTSLIYRLITKNHLENPETTKAIAPVSICIGEKCDVLFVDTPSWSKSDPDLLLAECQTADVVVICFRRYGKRVSFDVASKVICPRMEAFKSKKIHFILVGTASDQKLDFRWPEVEDLTHVEVAKNNVAKDDIQAVCDTIDAEYVECSARTDEGFEKLMDVLFGEVAPPDSDGDGSNGVMKFNTAEECEKCRKRKSCVIS